MQTPQEETAIIESAYSAALISPDPDKRHINTLRIGRIAVRRRNNGDAYNLDSLSTALNLAWSLQPATL